MKSEESERLKDRIRGSLELSIHEIEMLSDIIISIFELNYAMRQNVPEEIKAVRDKLSILKQDLIAEHKRRISLIDAAENEKPDWKKHLIDLALYLPSMATLDQIDLICVTALRNLPSWGYSHFLKEC